jgi:hypothetical protein
VSTTQLPTLRRVNHGRGHSYYIGDEKTPGVTSILGEGYPKPALRPWASKVTAQAAIDQWDDLLAMKPSERFEFLRTAADRDRDQAARRGTEVHNLAHAYMQDNDIYIPDELLGHVDAYIRFEQEWKPRELLLETPVAHTEFRYCGTVDLVADLADGNRWLLDLKTTRSGIFRDTAVQLAAYRYCDIYLSEDGVTKPMPQIDHCAAVWLRADRTYEFTPLETSPAEFRIFLYAKKIAEFAERDDVVLSPLDPPNGAK